MSTDHNNDTLFSGKHHRVKYIICEEMKKRSRSLERMHPGSHKITSTQNQCLRGCKVKTKRDHLKHFSSNV